MSLHSLHFAEMFLNRYKKKRNTMYQNTNFSISLEQNSILNDAEYYSRENNKNPGKSGL